MQDFSYTMDVVFPEVLKNILRMIFNYTNDEVVMIISYGLAISLLCRHCN